MRKMIWGKFTGETERALPVIDLIQNLKIDNFVFLEIASGDCGVIDRIAKKFPKACFIATDILKYHQHKKPDYKFMKTSLQDIIKEKAKYDFVMMLNSYRNFNGELRLKFDDWVRTHTKYFITSESEINDCWDGRYINGIDDSYQMIVYTFL